MDTKTQQEKQNEINNTDPVSGVKDSSSNTENDVDNEMPPLEGESCDGLVSGTKDESSEVKSKSTDTENESTDTGTGDDEMPSLLETLNENKGESTTSSNPETPKDEKS